MTELMYIQLNKPRLVCLNRKGWISLGSVSKIITLET